jgi:hypothetical protein
MEAQDGSVVNDGSDGLERDGREGQTRQYGVHASSKDKMCPRRCTGGEGRKER